MREVVRNRPAEAKGVWTGILGGLVLILFAIPTAVFVGMAAGVVTELFLVGWHLIR